MLKYTPTFYPHQPYLHNHKTLTETPLYIRQPNCLRNNNTEYI